MYAIVHSIIKGKSLYQALYVLISASFQVTTSVPEEKQVLKQVQCPALLMWTGLHSPVWQVQAPALISIEYSSNILPHISKKIRKLYLLK